MHRHKQEDKDLKDLEATSAKSINPTGDQDRSQLKANIKDEQMIKTLNKKGIVKLFPIQYETFQLIYKGEDVVAKDRTGSGKTLAFALPIITRMREQSKFKGIHSPKFLIVLPTRYDLTYSGSSPFRLRSKFQV